MRIGVNLLPLRPGEVGGAESYIRGLLDALGRVDRENEYVLVTADYNHASLEMPYANVRRRPLLGRRAPLDLVRRAINRLKRHVPFGRLFVKTGRGLRDEALMRVIEEEAIDLWFCPFGSLDPQGLAIPTVITVLDIQHEYLPEFFDQSELEHRREFFRRSAREATRVITISGFTKDTLVERYGVDGSRVVPVWLAIEGAHLDAAKNGRAGLGAALARYGLPESYFFYPANTWPHKNHVRLAEAFSLFKKRTGAETGLVLTGARKEADSALGKAIAALGLEGEVVYLGYVPGEDMPYIYAGAIALVFPSLFEGFGIPLLEAMGAGCPVIASDGTSIPEVAGDAALLFDPLDVEAIAGAMERVHGDAALREGLVRKGRARLRLFSYEETARKTLEVFGDASKAARRGNLR
jgi:glycosyltransferase involved in cell wall biosynthesis